MGKLVTFWSPFAGQAKVTSTMCAVAGAFGIQYPELEIALSHIKKKSIDLEERLEYRGSGKEKRELYERTGLSSMSLNYMQGLLTSEKIRHCAIPLIMKSLSLFPGTGKKEISEELLYQLLTDHLTEEFSAVFLDLGSERNELAIRLREAADLSVIVLPQYVPCWEKLFSEEEGVFAEKNTGFMLGGYLNKSRYGRKYLVRRFGGKGKLFGEIPMNAGYLDAMSEGRTLDFYLRNQWVEKKEENYEFMVQAKNAAKCFKTKLFDT